MGVLSVTEKWSESGGRTEKDQGRELQRVFQVITDSNEDTALTILRDTSNGLPQMGDPLPGDAFARCFRLQPIRVGPKFWELRCSYRSSAWSQENDNPLNRAPIWDWRNEPKLVSTDFDANGGPITNVVGQPLDPPMQKAVDDLILRIRRNQATFDPGEIVRFNNTVNLGYFLVPPGQAKMQSITANQIEEGDVTYFETAYEIAFRRPPPEETEMITDAAQASASSGSARDRNPKPDILESPTGSSDSGISRAWFRRVLNAGTHTFEGCIGRRNVNGELVDAGGNVVGSEGEAAQEPWWKPITDPNGDPVTSPVPLDENGKLLECGRDPVWLYFQMYPAISWTPLNLI